METQATTIAMLNDKFRREEFAFLFTSGVQALGDDEAVIKAVREYDSFPYDDDPYGEHDFGCFELLGERIFWKIDYYADDYRHWHDPIDYRCNRVLTVMLAGEY